jgi:hypothetical protein
MSRPSTSSPQLRRRAAGRGREKFMPGLAAACA